MAAPLDTTSTATTRPPSERSAQRPVRTRRPQSQPQEMFFAAPQDIVIYGGAAGGGKSWALLMEAARFIQTVPNFHAVVFRRTHTEIRNAGGLWDEAQSMYRGEPLRGIPNETRLEWTFPPYGNTITFAHMQHETDRFKWQGAQIPLIGFDELTTFTKDQFDYLLSRNRSTCGIRPYLRGTCNPDADSWVAEFIEWWIDQETGYPIPERAGRTRWFRRDQSDDRLLWGDEAADVLDPEDAENLPLSVTFIPANIYDNAILMAKDPGYLAKLRQLPRVERERLLGGNWKIRHEAGKVFDKSWFGIIDQYPAPVLCRVRYWDKAGTPGSSSWTAGVRMAVLTTGDFVVEHVERGQWLAPERETVIRTTARLDDDFSREQGVVCFPWIEQEPGSGGKESAERTQADLQHAIPGLLVGIERVTGEKTARATNMSWHAQARRILLLRGQWNAAYLDELYWFPAAAVDDQVDASSGAFNKLALYWKEAHPVPMHEDLIADELTGRGVPANEIGENFLEAELF
jgi:predicted phage terminase large subunit-like protein